MVRISSFVTVGNTVTPVRRPSPPGQRRQSDLGLPAASPDRSPVPQKSAGPTSPYLASVNRSGRGLPPGQSAPTFVAQSLGQAASSESAQRRNATVPGHHRKHLHATMAYRIAANDDDWIIGPVRAIQVRA